MGGSSQETFLSVAKCREAAGGNRTDLRSHRELTISDEMFGRLQSLPNMIKEEGNREMTD